MNKGFMKSFVKLRIRVTAVIMSVLFVFSISILDNSTAFAKANGAKLGEVIPEAAYEAGIAAISTYLPGGAVISPALDVICESFMDQGPTLEDLSGQIEQLRADISKEFADIKAQMKSFTQEIEDMIVNQTVIASKGSDFDKLMTAVQSTDRQMQAIMADTGINDQEKAVEVAMLIGPNSEWIKQDNMLFQYQDFMNTLGSSSFAEQKDRDLYQVVTDYFTSKAMFSGDALDMARPYIQRVLMLGLYAYSINSQCLKAAQTVSMFTDEDIAKLSTEEKNKYDSIVSLTSVVNNEINELNGRMFDTERTDSVVTHFISYETSNRLVFLNCGTENIEFSGTFSIVDLTTIENRGTFDFLTELMDGKGLTLDQIKAVAEYVKTYYPDETLRDYLKNLGFDTESVPTNAFLPVGEAKVYYSEGWVSSEGIGFLFYYSCPGIRFDDSSMEIQDHKCYMIETHPNGTWYPKQIADETVINLGL